MTSQRRKGRLKRRWMVSIEYDFTEKERTTEAEVDGQHRMTSQRRKGRLKRRWMDSIEYDLTEKERTTEAEIDGQHQV